MSKYHAKKVSFQGMIFDSKKECERYVYLKALENIGAIQNLEMQKKYVLIPAQYDESTELYKRGLHKGEPKPGKLLERELSYKADFVYNVGDMIVVEDVKGMRTKEYIIKRKLMLYIHGIRIKEV